MTNAGLLDLVTALTVPKKTGGGESKTCQMERFTRLVDLPVPSVLEVHAMDMTTIGGDEVARVECVTVGKDGERYSTVILISKRHAAEIVALPCILIYLGKKSQTNGNPYNWIVVVTEGNRRQANIPPDCVTREAADVFRNMKQGALEKIFQLYKPRDFQPGAVLAYDSLRRLAVRDTAPEGVSTGIVLASFRTYVDGKSVSGELMVPARCEKEANKSVPGIIQIGEETTARASGFKYVPLTFYPVSKVKALQDRLDGKIRITARLDPFVRSTNKSGVKEKTMKDESEVVVLSDGDDDDDGLAGEDVTTEVPDFSDDDDDTRGAVDADSTVPDSPESPDQIADGADDGDANGKGDDGDDGDDVVTLL